MPDLPILYNYSKFPKFPKFPKFSKFPKFPNLLKLSLLLLLIFAESVSDIAHSEARVIRIVAGLQPKHLSESCAIGGALYAKRKGANLTICSYNIMPPSFS